VRRFQNTNQRIITTRALSGLYYSEIKEFDFLFDGINADAVQRTGKRWEGGKRDRERERKTVSTRIVTNLGGARASVPIL